MPATRSPVEGEKTPREVRTTLLTVLLVGALLLGALVYALFTVQGGGTTKAPASSPTSSSLVPTVGPGETITVHPSW